VDKGGRTAKKGHYFAVAAQGWHQPQWRHCS